MNILCSVCYDGTNYSGWQKQPNAITIQETIETALAKIYSGQISTITAGRTDTGVHALKNYFNFHINDEQNKIPINKIALVLNNQLPKDIRIISAAEMPESFNARFNAIKRIYEYRISWAAFNPFERNYKLFIYSKPNIDLMNAAAKLLIGEYDFNAFRAADCCAKTTIRTIYDISLYQPKSDELIISIIANAFLKQMVRIIVGTLLDIGYLKKKVMDMQNILLSRQRKFAGQTVKPFGLFFKDAIFA